MAAGSCAEGSIPSMVAVRESAEASAVGKVIVTPSTLPVRSAIWL